MHNEYKILMTLTETLNTKLLSEIIALDKNNFVSNDNLVNIAIGIIDEAKKITDHLPSDFYVLNPTLCNHIVSIRKYHSSLLDNNLLVNAYKLYDFIKIDLNNLKIYLNNLNN